MKATLLTEAPKTNVRSARISVALVGNPNTGKTTLFNALCGVRARTSNYPGTTTAIRLGRSESASASGLEVIDLPGLYDLHGDALAPRLARDVLARVGPHDPDVILMVVDACNLTRNLVLVGEVLAYGRPVVIALNMSDVARRRELRVDAPTLSRVLHVPVVSIAARTLEGVARLREVVSATARRGAQPISEDLPTRNATLEELTSWADRVAQLSSPSTAQGEPDVDAVAERLDGILTHPLWGMVAFAAIMCGLFWALFALAAIPMALIEAIFGQLGTWVTAVFPPGPVRALLTDGIIGGVAGTLVFLPQICLLFFLISLLEDTGYLARAAFLTDGMLSRFGLPGHAFVPLLTSHACALPGIMSARLIANERDRLATILIAPFMSCSARLPVYVLLTSLLFADRPLLAALAFAGCYALGGIAGLLTASLFGRTVLKGRPRPMILELPPYRTPSVTNALLTAKDQGVAFLRTAGTVIVAICIVMWWLSAYPTSMPPAEALALRAEAAQGSVSPARAETLMAEAEALEARATQASSFAGRAGRLIAPVFQPLGLDWQLTVGVLTSFMAREVFVSTMAVLEGGAADPALDQGIIDRVGRMRRDDGTLLFTPATAASALVFFVLAMQCLPTLAVTRRESGSRAYAWVQFGYMSGVAYLAALAVHVALGAVGVT